LLFALLAQGDAAGAVAPQGLAAAIKTYPQRIRRGQAVLVHVTVTNQGTTTFKKTFGGGGLPFDVAIKDPDQAPGDAPRVILPWTHKSVRDMTKGSISVLALEPKKQATFVFWLGYEDVSHDKTAPYHIRCVFSDPGDYVVSIWGATAKVKVEEGKSWMQDVRFGSRLLALGCYRNGGGADLAQQVLPDYIDEYNRTIAFLFAGQSAEALEEAKAPDLKAAVRLHAKHIGPRPVRQEAMPMKKMADLHPGSTLYAPLFAAIAVVGVVVCLAGYLLWRKRRGQEQG